VPLKVLIEILGRMAAVPVLSAYVLLTGVD
jgi:hypothetical protein